MEPLDIEKWHDFCLTIGTAAGVIVGATFVVATLAPNIEKRALGIRGFISPTTVHLGSVLISSAILTVPTLTALFLAVLLGLGGLAGMVYGGIVWTRITKLKIDLSDRCWYGILPILAYALLAVSAMLVRVAVGPGIELVATALVSLLIIGMRNAWDMATFIVIGGPAAPETKTG